MYGSRMANTDMYWSSTKEANTRGSRVSVDRNSSMGLAISFVSEILERSSSTSGSILTMVSRVSSVKMVSALMYGCGERSTAGRRGVRRGGAGEGGPRGRTHPCRT